jgi:metal-responsive CopG/Arc/MetJ family transcriptional regulator
MKTIQMTIDDALLQEVDRTVQNLITTRSTFIRLA